MKKVLIFILSTVVIQSYAAIQWNCTSPDIQQSYLPKECTGIGSGNTSASSGSSSANPNIVAYDAIAACAKSAKEGSTNTACLPTLLDKLNLPAGYSIDPQFGTQIMCGTTSCRADIFVRPSADTSSGNIIILRNEYPASSTITAFAQAAGISNPSSIIICEKGNVSGGVCPAGTYSYLPDDYKPGFGTATGLKKN